MGAGVAVFKPEAASGIQLRVRDEEGNDPLEGAFVWGNFHQCPGRSIRRRPGIPETTRGLLFPTPRTIPRPAGAGSERNHSLVGSRNRGPGRRDPLGTIL